MNSTNLTLLYDLGLTDQEARSYLALLELGQGTVADIAARAGIKRTSVYNFIDRLLDMGIVQESVVGKRRVYEATPPTMLIELQEKRLKRLHENVGELLALANLSPKKPRIRYFEGVEQMRQVELESLNCKEELAIWNRARVVGLLGEKYMEELDQKRREKGVKIRLIAVQDEELVFTGGHADESREIRYAPKGLDFPMAISIYDNGKVGFITSKDEGFAILIESRELERTLRAMFEGFWQVSGESE